MHSVSYGAVKYYNLTEGSSIPEWLSQRKKGELAKEQRQRRVEVLQDLEFKGGSPTALALTDDLNHLWIAGEYPPQLRCYDLSEVSVKFNRHVDSQVVGIAPLSADYRKIALLQRDRWVEFHSQGGRHARVRTPKEGRAIACDARTASLLISTSCPSVYLFDCDTGAFKEPLVTSAEANDSLSVCPAHPLLAVGGTHGKVECADLRIPNRIVSVLNVGASLPDFDGDSDVGISITALAFDPSGMLLMAGTSEGTVGIYDIRKRSPVMVKDHNNALPVKQLQHHVGFGRKSIVSGDSKGVKIWDAVTGDPFTSLDTSAELLGFAIPKSSKDRDGGVILAACDTPHVNTFFVPQLGPAPGWCSYLESITEELEETEDHTGLYEDFKFVTREELEKLHLTHLLKGENDQIRPYMHGFYVDLNLYRTTKAVMDPNELREYKRQVLLRKKEAEDRITVVKKKRDLLKPVKEDPEAVAKADERFAAKLKGEGGERFNVDRASDAYLRYNPHLRGADLGAFKKVEQDEDEDDDADYASEASSGLSDSAPAMVPRLMKGRSPAELTASTAKRKLSMHELSEGRKILETAKEAHQARKREVVQTIPLGERLKQRKQGGGDVAKVSTADGGASKTITFELQDKNAKKRKRSNQQETEDEEGGKGRSKGGKGKGKGKKGDNRRPAGRGGKGKKGK